MRDRHERRQAMDLDAKREVITREGVQALLSDAEEPKVSRAEGESRLVEGDEYVDLEDPGAGVQQVLATSPRPRTALPRSAVSDATWTKVVALRSEERRV